MKQTRNAARAFTLVELLVVIAVIGILIAVLLPALAGVRQQAQSVTTLSNAKQSALALIAYTSDGGFGFNDARGPYSGGNGELPPSYLYAADTTGGSFRFEDQQDTLPGKLEDNGYIHWSYFLFDGDFIPTEAFQSPLVRDGGAPRTNPGPDPENWVTGQVNSKGQTAATSAKFPEDRQAERVAFTGNAAIFPRNKFVNNRGVNHLVTNNGRPTDQTRLFARLVKISEISRPSETILFTEFKQGNNWEPLIDTETNDGQISGEIKSHRPITPFFGVARGARVFDENPRGVPAFRYPPENEYDRIVAEQDLGSSIVDFPLAAVGRAHAGNRTVFVRVDGSAIRGDLIDSVRDRQWGDEFYSMHSYLDRQLIDDSTN